MNHYFVRMVQKMPKSVKCTIKDEELDKELESFSQWLNKQINKSLYRKYRIRKPLKEGYKRQILKKLKVVLRTHIGKLPSELTKRDIVKWEDFSYKQYENNGNLGRFQAINKLLDYLGGEEWKLKLPYILERNYDTLSEEERDRYIKTANELVDGIPLFGDVRKLTPRQMKKVMDRAIVLMQATLESRPTELCNIETRDVSLERDRIPLRDSKTHEDLIWKGMEDVYLLTPLVKQALKDWLRIRNNIHANNPENEKYLFIHPSGKYKGERLGYSKILLLCKEIGVKAGITSTRTTPYCLKRTEITRDCDRTANLRIPQIRARHSNINSTMRYNKKKTKDAIEYIQSEKYEDSLLPFKTKLRRLAEKAVTGEISVNTWQQLKADLMIGEVEKKNEHDLVGYG